MFTIVSLTTLQCLLHKLDLTSLVNLIQCDKNLLSLVNHPDIICDLNAKYSLHAKSFADVLRTVNVFTSVCSTRDRLARWKSVTNNRLSLAITLSESVSDQNFKCHFNLPFTSAMQSAIRLGVILGPTIELGPHDLDLLIKNIRLPGVLGRLINLLIRTKISTPARKNVVIEFVRQNSTLSTEEIIQTMSGIFPDADKELLKAEVVLGLIEVGKIEEVSSVINDIPILSPYLVTAHATTVQTLEYLRNIDWCRVELLYPSSSFSVFKWKYQLLSRTQKVLLNFEQRQSQPLLNRYAPSTDWLLLIEFFSPNRNEIKDILMSIEDSYVLRDVISHLKGKLEVNKEFTPYLHTRNLLKETEFTAVIDAL